jgi:hypothetical protein
MNKIPHYLTTEQPLDVYNITEKSVSKPSDDDNYLLQMALVGLLKWPPLVYIPFGVVGNLTSFLVTTKKGNRNISTCVYMSALSVVDTMVLLSALFYRLLFAHDLGTAIRDRFNSMA